MKIQNLQILSTDLNLKEVLEIEGELTLDPTKNITISTTKNIIVTGKLISRPNADVNHIIRFTGIDETKFIGSTDTVLDGDIGYWVMNGELDLKGISNTEWKQLGTDAIALQGFASTISSNLRIEGTVSGYSHLFIKSNKPQSIKGVSFRWMGPRKDVNGDGVKELVTGRYACHFHHSENGSRGSIIEGCIARDCNNHCFVPHGSHGITMRNNIVYNVLEAPFWYDFGHRTHDLVWENNLVVKVGYVPRSQDQDSGGAPTFGAGGFVLGSGNGNKCNGNLVISTSGDPRSAGAYIWPELRDDADNTKQLEDGWEFENNTAINCPSGIQVWQNNLHHHIVRNTTIINCPVAIFHGAYQNHYHYIGGKIVKGYIDVRASSATTNRVRFEGVDIDAAGLDYCVQINEGPLDGVAPILLLKCILKNWKKAAIIDQNPGAGKKSVDVVNCNILPSAIIVTATKSGETVRLQEGNKAWQITKTTSKEIPIFAPTTWGVGNGVKAEYFSTDFKTKYLERIEPNINLFDITHPSPHYAVPTAFAARWTGKIQPQYTENYTFYCNAGGGIRLTVNGKSLINKWAEKYPGEIKSTTVSLEAGKSYDFKLEFFNEDDRSGCTLEWSSPSLKREFIPMSQLYTEGTTPPQPPVNQPPIVNAGNNKIISLTFDLNGTASDPDGTIPSFLWEKVSGPSCTIITPTTLNTQVGNLGGVGVYKFKLTATDDKGAQSSSEVTYTIN